jgi:hypothetical protein
MEHPCYKCGHSIEDGRPFCLQCGAPQIRVAMPEAAALPAAENASLSVPVNTVPVNNVPVNKVRVNSVPANDAPILPPPLDAPTVSSGIEWPRALRACAIAAAISILVMTLRLMVPPLAMLAAGCLAVIFYQRRNPLRRVDARSGAQLGAATGLLSAVVVSVFFAIFLLVLQSGGQARQEMMEALQQIVSRSHDSQAQAFLDLLNQPEGLAEKLIIGMAGVFLVSIAAGSLAGALTGAFFSRRKR